MQNHIYHIRQSDIHDNNLLLNYIYPNIEHNYYYSDDFSPSFYIELAHKGFISVSQKIEDNYILLPEIQFEYAVLDFEKLHISKKVKQLLKNSSEYSFVVDRNIIPVVDKIISYHDECWLEGNYKQMLSYLTQYKHPNIDFELLTCKIIDKNTQNIIAAEIGYKIGATYTSLSGFCSKEKRYNNYGKLQMTLLAQYLQNKEFDFWNLGHPYMQYKLDLGAKIFKREEFIKRWSKSVDK
ncbi:MAG: hypothetical protein U9Q04_02300, partial [Campylobacterota bacterium]|nr:hypothetical protein [Campylobacterota bacterium]